MFPKQKRIFFSPSALLSTLIIFSVLTLSTQAQATTRLLNSWRVAYPNSLSDDNLADPCALCHTDSYSELNSYGWDMGQNNNDYAALESLNSDNDPNNISNIDEINGDTQPGWTEGANNVVNGGAVSSNALPAEIIAGLLDLEVINQAPVADIGGPYSGTQNVELSFDASNSSDTDGIITSYAWDFGDGSSGNGVQAAHTYTSTGSFNVTLIVTDDQGNSTTASTAVSIGAGNQPPVANAMGPYTSQADETITFDGSGSTDADGMITSYDWNFGDGSFGTGISPTHAYADSGTYNVTLTVTDDNNAVDSDVTSVSVEQGNLAPAADPRGPYAGTVNESIAFDASSSSDTDGQIVSYTWDFGDGTTGTGVTPSHSYTDSGVYNISLQVTDDSGSTATGSTTATIGDVVNEPPAAVTDGPYTGTVNQPLDLSAADSTDSDGLITTYAWDFGDGNSANGVNVTHTYSDAGSFNITLTVTDSDGIIDTVTTTAVIGLGNLTPTADINGPYTATANTEIVLDGSGSVDPDGSIVAYDWDFGDNSTGTGPKPSHTYSAQGTYNVTLTVHDDSGAMDSAATTVTVTSADDPGISGSAKIIKKFNWGMGFLGIGVISNDTDKPIENWEISFDAEFDIKRIWGAEVVSHAEDNYILKGNDDNQSILPGEKVRFAIVAGPADSPIPNEITVIDRGESTQGNFNHNHQTEVMMKSVNDWKRGFQGMATIRNIGDEVIEGWTISFKADFEIKKLWNAKLVSHSGNNYVLSGKRRNRIVKPDHEVTFGFIASPSGAKMPSSFLVNGIESEVDVVPGSEDDTETGDDSETDDEDDTDSDTGSDDDAGNGGETDNGNDTDDDSDTGSDDDTGNDGETDNGNETDGDNDTGSDDDAGNGGETDNGNDTDGDNDTGSDNDAGNGGETDNGNETDGDNDTGSDNDAGNGGETDNGNETDGDNDTGSDDDTGNGGETDNGNDTDSGSDTGTEDDAGNDGETDNGNDTDSGSDTGTEDDAGNDGETDSGNDTGSDDQANNDSDPGTTVGGVDCTGAVFGSSGAPIRRLNQVEYQNTVTSLFPGASLPSLNLPVDQRMNGFTNAAEGQAPSALAVEQYATAAESIATAAIQSLASWAPCSNSNDEACARSALNDIAPRIYRHPLTAEESTAIDALIDGGLNAATPEEALSLAITALLESPNFLYRPEFGSSNAVGNARELDAYELASRLSYFFWATVPDSALLAAAEDGSLLTDSVLRAQANRMLNDPRARPVLTDFFVQWLGLYKLDTMALNTDAFPEFDNVLRSDLKTSVIKYVEHALWNTDSWSVLMSGSYGYVNDRLAPIFGVAAPNSDQLVQVNLDMTERAGVLTQPGTLASTSHDSRHSPILRGVQFLTGIVCAPPPAPAAIGMPDENLVVDESQVCTTRDEVSLKHTASAGCAACHDAIDSAGFNFEHYDALGRYRAVENGCQVDATGSFAGTDITGTIQSAVDLALQLPTSRTVSSCMSEHMFRFALGRNSSSQDACEITNLSNQLTNTDSMQSLVIELVMSPSFRSRPTIN
ncbi:MAG: PKD domain-containing protein [Candidatus Thiodiazotropha sp. 6PLUC2]